MIKRGKHLVGETRQFKIYFHLQNNRLANLHDFYPIYKSKNQLDSILITTLEYPLRESELQIYQAKFNEKEFCFDISNNFYKYNSGFVHARNYIQDYITNDHYLDFLVFDHGYDAPPFPGGKPRLFSYINGEYSENSAFFDCEKSFAFSGCSGDWDNDGFPEVIVFDPSSHSGALFYRNDGTRLIREDSRFPNLKSDLNFTPLSGSCFRTFDNKSKLVIGSLGDQVSSESEIILTPDPFGNFDSNKISYLPTRRGGKDWVCVSIEPVRFAGDEVDQLLAVYHDGAVQNGFIEMYSQKDENRFEYFDLARPIAEDADCWFYRYRTLNYSVSNENPDSIIALKSRGLKKFVPRDYNFILLNKIGNKFIDISENLSPLLGKEFSGVVTKRNSNTGLDDIVFFDNHGNYYYCHNKN